MKNSGIKKIDLVLFIDRKDCELSVEAREV